MGGCASKPKGLKAEIGEAPAPAPAPAKEELGSFSEIKEVEEEASVDASDGKDKEIVEDDKFDDQANKRRSLSLLFKENETLNDKTRETENAQPDPDVIKEEPTEKAKEESEVENWEISNEQIPTSVADAAPEKFETEKIIETKTVAEPEENKGHVQE